VLLQECCCAQESHAKGTKSSGEYEEGAPSNKVDDETTKNAAHHLNCTENYGGVELIHPHVGLLENVGCKENDNDEARPVLYDEEYDHDGNGNENTPGKDGEATSPE